MRFARGLGVLVFLLVGACAGDPAAPTGPLPTPLELGVAPIGIDARGIPTLLHAVGPTSPVARTAGAVNLTEAAIAHLTGLAPAWRVRGTVPDLVGKGEVTVLGGTIVRVAQQLEGVPVYHGELRVFVRPSGALVSTSGTLRDADSAQRPLPAAADEAAAIARAVGPDPDRVVERARAQRMWFPVDGVDGRDTLIGGWQVEAFTALHGQHEAIRTLLAADLRVLERQNLTADAFSYRVWAEPDGEQKPLDGPIADFSPHPTGHPDGSYPAYIPPNLVTVDGLNHPPGGGPADPWLPADATQTTGNNVDAYVDLDNIDGLSAGDFHATPTGAGTFDRTYDVAVGPLASTAQQQAAITELFYTLNWLHDFWYDAGFTEAAGNAQLDNYGRGGMGADPILGESQDKALDPDVRNNANMSTPDDGMSPKMQVYLWTGKDERALTLAGASRPLATGVAGFGPRDFDVTAPLAHAVDGTAPTGDACSALTTSVAGKIAIIDRGLCQFQAKAATAQTAGALGVIIVDNTDASAPPTMSSGDGIEAIAIPVFSVTKAVGATLTDGTVATFHRLTGPEADGSLDNTTVAHEFGHYLHHRLTQCGNTICRAMSEGWGDFDALLMMLRPGDDLNGAYPFSVYATQGISSDAGYFGIRRQPYSVSFDKNALTFRVMAEGEVLPTQAPIIAKGTNSEVHNAGEVWTTMLWEGYVALQKAGPSYETVRAKMARYVVAGLLMTPPDGTITEARDAILEAAAAASPADHDVLAAAFARRGFGSCAVPPPKDSSDFVGIVESMRNNGRVVPAVPTLVDSVKSCDDDGILDANETAQLTVQVTNPGPADVTDVTVQLTSDVDGMEILGEPLHVDRWAAYATMPFTAQVKLGNVRGAIAGHLAIEVTAADACEPSLAVPVAARFNVDDSPMTASKDTFDAVSIWTTQPAGQWTQQRATALDGFWGMRGSANAAEAVLVSPDVKVGITPLTITFDQRFKFETNMDAPYDGGVIEVSTDQGQHWDDVAALVSASPYTGTLAQSENPLTTRMAFVGQNAAYPNRDTVTLAFGTQFAGKQLRLRFHFGSDQGTASEGWQVDNVDFKGIVGTPFPSQVPDNGDCSGKPAQPGGDDDGGCCQSSKPTGSLVLGFVVLGLVAGRRRRRC